MNICEIHHEINGSADRTDIESMHFHIIIETTNHKFHPLDINSNLVSSLYNETNIEKEIEFHQSYRLDTNLIELW